MPGSPKKTCETLSPKTCIYNYQSKDFVSVSSLAMVKVDPHTKNQGQRTNRLTMRVTTNRQMDIPTRASLGGRTDRQMLLKVLSPCYTVDNYYAYGKLLIPISANEIEIGRI